MIDRREQALTYALLGVFSLIALVPIVGILLTALQAPGAPSSSSSLTTQSARRRHDAMTGWPSTRSRQASMIASRER